MSLDITKKEFDAAYDQHLPKAWIRFAFKYFSKSTEKKNMKPNKTIVGVLISLFLVGFFATAFKLPRAIIATVTYAYMVLLTILVFFLLAAVWANNFRLKKVMKILGVSKTEYNKLADKYYD
jgi:cobalamin biosynthesis protein CobD/CbiB